MREIAITKKMSQVPTTIPVERKTMHSVQSKFGMRKKIFSQALYATISCKGMVLLCRKYHIFYTFGVFTAALGLKYG